MELKWVGSVTSIYRVEDSRYCLGKYRVRSKQVGNDYFGTNNPVGTRV